AVYAVAGLLKQGDEGAAAGLGLGKAHGGLDLGQHGAGREVALGAVLGGLGGGDGVQPLLLGLAEVDGGLLDGGEDDEVVGVELLGEDLAGEVLVDDGGRALEVVALGGEHGDAAAAAGDDYVVAVHERANGVQLDDRL